MNDRIDLARMQSLFNDPDGRYVSVRDEANVLALIIAVRAAKDVLDAYRAPRPGGVVEAVMALDSVVTDRFDFGDAA